MPDRSPRGSSLAGRESTQGPARANFLPGERAMSKIVKPLTVAMGAALLGTVAISAYAKSSAPFAADEMQAGYQQLGEGKCGEDKGKEGKCGEGKCGG